MTSGGRPCKNVETSTDVNLRDFAGLDLLSGISQPTLLYQLRAETTDAGNSPDEPSISAIEEPSISAIELWKPLLDPSVDGKALTPQQIDKTLDYLLLGSQRVRQMTRTYNDAEAVSRLLLDREKDLELAAKIGKTLLERNHELQQTNEMLEEQLNNANDQVTQLKHDLQQKVNLLQMVTDEEYDRSSAQCDDLSSLTDLQKKLKLLEEENSNLKLEANHLKSLTESLEEREQQLINDCVRQLSESSAQLGAVSTQLNDKTDALMKQQNQIMNLLAEVNQLHQNEAKLCADAEELRCSLYAARETQAELSQELIDVQERYAEVLNLLSEARDEIRNLSEQKDIKSATSSNIDSLFGSLASELEASVGSHGGQRQFFEGENLGDSLLDPRSAVAAPSQAVLKFESAATAVPQDPQSLRDLSSESPKRAYDCAYGSSTSLAICLEPTVQPVCR